MNNYNREAAVSYAIKYALETNTKYKYFQLINNIGGDCTNFVSQCLYAGGAPMDYNNVRPWWYNSGQASICWAVSHSLFWYLKVNLSLNRNKIKGLEVEDISKLEIGDIIFYENHKNIIFHSAIVTSFTESPDNKEPLISQHTFDLLNGPYLKSYDFKKVHFIKIIL